MRPTFKLLSGNSSCLDIGILFYLFEFVLKFPWFLEWMIFYWNLSVLDTTLLSCVLYKSFLARLLYWGTVGEKKDSASLLLGGMEGWVIL